jgi:hypothetical protein
MKSGMMTKETISRVVANDNIKTNKDGKHDDSTNVTRNVGSIV